MKEGYTVKNNFKSLLGIAVSLLVILVCCIVVLSMEANGESEILLKNTTIYTTENEGDIIDKVKSNGIYFDIEGSTEQKLFKDYIDGISIVDMDNLDIQINADSNVIVIKSKDNEESEKSSNNLETIYQGIIANIQSDNTTYRSLMSQFELDELRQVKNVLLDDEAKELKIYGIGNEPIDARILYMQVDKTDSQNRESGLRLGDATADSKSILFKPEAVYGKATSDIGRQALAKIKGSDGIIWSSKNGRVYQIVSFESLVDILTKEKKSTPSIERLKITGLASSNKKEQITVYFDDELGSFGGQVIELLNHLEYEVIQSEDMEGCDLIIGYTWMHMNGIQSALDEDLNSALSKYVLTGETNEDIGLMFRSAWSLIS